MDFADKQVTEISCHGLGAPVPCASNARGNRHRWSGQQVIQLDDDGNLCDFPTNEQCAAGTWRFLEVISRTLSHQRRATRQHYQNVTPHAITSMCTVFAESEVI
ncbi:BadF/BadG/BcrA/BcrD ATPase family protein [Shigella boydii]